VIEDRAAKGKDEHLNQEKPALTPTPPALISPVITTSAAQPAPTPAVTMAPVARGNDFKTVDGKQYKNVTVSKIEPDGIVVITKSGISKLYFTELPKEGSGTFSLRSGECPQRIPLNKLRR
jgi:hypothetical protein